MRQGPISSSPLQEVERPVPLPRVGEALIAVSLCAICRTDLHVIEGDLPPLKLPLIPGHQIVGRVVALGNGAEVLRVGDRVGVAWLRWTCGTCAFCRTDRENLCAASRYNGWSHDGGFAEYVLAPESFVYPIADALSDQTAAPLLCAGMIGFRSLKRAALPSGGTLALYGFGSSAHIILQIAKSRGARVFVSTRDPGHQEFARSMGADWVGRLDEQLPAAADSAIIFAPSGELVPFALENLAKGGTLVLAGIHMSQIPPLDYQRHLFFEKTIRSVTSNTRQDGRELLREAANAGVQPRLSTYLLAEANRALNDLKCDRISGTGLLLVGNV